jgi:hypothetical protein
MEHGRRRLVGKVLVALTWAYATGFALYVLGMAIVQPVYWTGAPQGARVPALLLGMAVLALDVVWIVLFLREVLQGEGSQYLLSKTAEGTARISLRAVQASLLRRAREAEEVIGVRLVLHRPVEKRLRVEVSYTTTEDRNAIQVSEALRRTLRERFGELVQPEEGFEVEFDVKVEGFVPGTAPASEPAAPGEEREPFTGPRYPVD